MRLWRPTSESACILFPDVGYLMLCGGRRPPSPRQKLGRWAKGRGRYGTSPKFKCKHYLNVWLTSVYYRSTIGDLQIVNSKILTLQHAKLILLYGNEVHV